ncbi:IS630 family transposase [Aquibium oceanicum]|uniref:IS630 family transposase n=1 Tax=Aquibium oceanicum TaxID=1670800 RepID=UPI0036122CFC
MSKPHPMALRERVAGYVDEGHGHREAAQHFLVPPRFVNDLIKLRRETGSLKPRRQGHAPGSGKLAPHVGFVRRRMAQARELTLDELCVELEARGCVVHRSSVGRLLHRIGLSQKKALRATEQLRPEVRAARELWTTGRKPFFARALTRLVFIDETSTNTKLTKRTGWSPKGERYVTHAPFGHWRTQSFVASLRSHGLVAPWIVEGAMKAEIFERYVETQLAPELGRGDVVILDNVGFHKSGRAADLVRQRGAWMLFLPPYSPDLNPIEMALSKLKALLRKKAARTFDAVATAIGDICDLLDPQQCRDFFSAAGYEVD